MWTGELNIWYVAIQRYNLLMYEAKRIIPYTKTQNEYYWRYRNTCRQINANDICPQTGSTQFHAQEPTSSQVSNSWGGGTSERIMIFINK